MAGTITLFAALTAATGAELDADLTLVSNQAPIPVTVSGTNTLTLTQVGSGTTVYAVTAYVQGMQFVGEFAGTNTGAMTAQLGSLSALAIYKDTPAGPVAMTGNECVTNNAFSLVYDSALNSGAGGFHAYTATGEIGATINPTAIKLGSGTSFSTYLSTLASVTFTVAAANSAQAVTISLTGAVPNNNVMIGPPTNHPNGLALTGYVSASGSVVLAALNGTGASIASIAGSYRVSVFQ